MRGGSGSTSGRKAIKIADAAAAGCENIEALGELLAAAAESGSGGQLPPETVAHAGAMISEEARELRALVRLMQKKLVK